MDYSKCNGRIVWYNKTKYKWTYTKYIWRGWTKRKFNCKRILDSSKQNALNMHTMTIKDWTNELDSFF